MLKETFQELYYNRVALEGSRRGRLTEDSKLMDRAGARSVRSGIPEAKIFWKMGTSGCSGNTDPWRACDLSYQERL
jgi:hypothetical protein